jgi:N-acetylglucosaminyl-diphospho-decaprenol L-rhamnosyltransferase
MLFQRSPKLNNKRRSVSTHDEVRMMSFNPKKENELYAGASVIHVAIVSHGHEDMLIASHLGGLGTGNERLKIWIKDNKPSEKFKLYCRQQNAAYFDEQPGLGFGHNNNFLFRKIQASHGFQSQDSFLVMNPDITIAPETIFSLVERMHQDHSPIATINLYRDLALSEYDANIRRFPDATSLARLAVMRSVSEPYNKAEMQQPCQVDWASGAFIAFDAAHYCALEGFDERYFMYFEDVDICYRSNNLFNEGVRYYPALQAVHMAAHRNRNVFSKHAFWFFSSFVRFLSLRYFTYGKRGLPKGVN